eukprot:292562_1
MSLSMRFSVLSCIFLTFIDRTVGYYTVWLEGYPGNLKLIELPDLTAVTIAQLDLTNVVDITPSGLEGRCGNPDVSSDGKKIVFGAITASTDSWDIYEGDLNIPTGSIDNLVNIIPDIALRDEDPRFSYDASTFIYKSGAGSNYDIALYDMNTGDISTAASCSCPSDCS